MRAVNKQVDGSRPGVSLPSATIEKSRLSWLLWLIPAGAVAICAWFIFRDYVSAGPLITIYFKDAEGLEQQNTPIIYRGAIVGQVKGVELTKDEQQVAVTARLAGEARNLAKEGSIFWIVRPELKVGAISGLRTIVSGEYIAVQPGSGMATNVFAGANEQPISEQPNALKITLIAPDLGSLQEGSPIFYRGIQVGEVLYYQIGLNAHDVVIHARVWSQYAPLVRVDTKFWNAGGFDFHFGIFKGVQITAESPRTVISGGIQFATPTEVLGAATNNSVFALFEKPEEKWKEWEPTISLQLPSEAFHTNAPGASLLK